jgi:hypothetical protein
MDRSQWAALKSAKQIALRSGGAIDVNGLAGEHRVNRCSRWTSYDTHAVFESTNDERDTEFVLARLED